MPYVTAEEDVQDDASNSCVPALIYQLAPEDEGDGIEVAWGKCESCPAALPAIVY